MREIPIHTPQSGRPQPSRQAPARPQARPAGQHGQARTPQKRDKERKRPMPAADTRPPFTEKNVRPPAPPLPRQGVKSRPPAENRRPAQGYGPQNGRLPGPDMEEKPPLPIKKTKKKRRAKKALPEAAPQKRRITRAEARRGRLKKRIWTFLVIFLLIGVGIYVSVTLLFKIGKYEIQGESPYTLEEMTEAFGHAQGENIFSFSLADAEKQIAQKLPYLESVKVRRRLPDTIVFIVEPAQESYCAPGAGGYVVLSKQFKILRATEEPPSELCRIEGVSAKSAVAGTVFQAETEEQQALMEELLPALEKSGVSGIGQIDLTDSYALSFTVNGGKIRVLLGTTVKLDYKLEIVYEMLTDQLAPDSEGTLDVSAAPSTRKTIFKQDVTK